MSTDRDDDDFDDRPRRRRRDDDFDDRPRESNGMATAALVLGVMSLLCTVFSGIPAVICGVIGLNRASRTGTGKGLAIAGIVLGAIGILTVPIMLALLLPAVQKVRQAAARSQSTNNLKQVGLAAINFHDSTTAFPTADHRRAGEVVPVAEAANRLSWRFTLLPYANESALYQQYQASAGQAWNSPANLPLSSRVVRAYADPADGVADTRYRALVGPGAIFDPTGDRPTRIPDITDGTSNTILFIESADTVPWPQNKELPFNRNGPFPAVGHPGERNILVVFADGSVRGLSKSVNPALLTSATTRAGGEVFLLE